MDEEKWEVACRASGMTNANIVAGRLETEGIPTKLKYEAVGAIYAITINRLGEVEIMVPESLLDKAREILTQSYDDKDINWEESC
jgi:hypothetical protein